MRKSFAFGILGAALFALPLLRTAPAHANIAACGNIDVEANGSCDVRVNADCDVSCTPISVDAACHAKLQASCAGSCPRVPMVDCQASCQGDCAVKCNLKPAEFDCTATCRADASAKCDGQCASSGNKSECQASCQATISADCDAGCKVKPGTADCTGQCKVSCDGSCTAQTELECQVDCQAKGYADCELDVKGGCEAACSKPEGALFCNGDYIDHGGALKDCIDAIQAALPTVTVTGSAQGSSNCANGTCTAEGSANASANCAFAPSKAGPRPCGRVRGLRRRRRRLHASPQDQLRIFAQNEASEGIRPRSLAFYHAPGRAIVTCWAAGSCVNTGVAR